MYNRGKIESPQHVRNKENFFIFIYERRKA